MKTLRFLVLKAYYIFNNCIIAYMYCVHVYILRNAYIAFECLCVQHTLTIHNYIPAYDIVKTPLFWTPLGQRKRVSSFQGLVFAKKVCLGLYKIEVSSLQGPWSRIEEFHCTCVARGTSLLYSFIIEKG